VLVTDGLGAAAANCPQSSSPINTSRAAPIRKTQNNDRRNMLRVVLAEMMHHQ